jgi:hypothetical protein
MQFLKSYSAWIRSRGPLRLSLWTLWLIGLGLFTWFIDPIGGAAGYILFLCYLFLSIRAHKKPLTILLIAALLWSQTPARAEPLNPPPSNPQPQLMVECIFAGIILIVGGIVIIKLHQFCKAHFPPPPPPPPTNNVPTNPPPPAPFPAFASLTLAASPDYTDISTNGWIDSSQPTNPVPYLCFLTVPLNVSTDLLTWSNAWTLNCWLSSNSVTTVLCDASGNPLCTNRTLGNPFSTNTCLTNYVPCPKPSQPQLFIRDW